MTKPEAVFLDQTKPFSKMIALREIHQLCIKVSQARSIAECIGKFDT